MQVKSNATMPQPQPTMPQWHPMTAHSQPLTAHSQPMTAQSQPVMLPSQPMMLQSHTMLQPQPVVYIQTLPSRTSNMYPNYASKTAMGLAVVQLVTGILCVILTISLLSSGAFGPIGTSILWGILFIIAGGLGMGSASTKTRCLIVSFMVMSIICSLCALVVTSMSGIVAASQDEGGNVGVGATLAFLGFLEFIIAIVSSSVCCKALCGCCMAPTVAVVQYVDRPGTVAYVHPATAGISYHSSEPPVQRDVVRVSHSQPTPSTNSGPAGHSGDNTPSPPSYYEVMSGKV